MNKKQRPDTDGLDKDIKARDRRLLAQQKKIEELESKDKKTQEQQELMDACVAKWIKTNQKNADHIKELEKREQERDLLDQEKAVAAKNVAEAKENKKKLSDMFKNKATRRYIDNSNASHTLLRSVTQISHNSINSLT